jgi:hypothetical protein
MREKILHTTFNLLMEPGMYRDVKRASKQKNVPMSEIVREGIRRILSEIEKENNAVLEVYGDERKGR